MQTVNTLTGSWEAYNERKALKGQDPNCFSPEEIWEFDFLVNLIQEEKPHVDQLMVILSIREGMRRTMAPRPRQRFLEMVMDNLSQREMQWTNLLQSMS